MKPLITNIQRFCVHDGPGIRTTVFFKGCSLRCPWCANPENISFEEEYYYIREKCSNTCKFVSTCLAFKTGKACYADMKNCCYGAIGKFGKYYTDEELYEELIKDIDFYENEGGITFSGGECLLFLPYYKELLKKLKEKKISICVETALFIPCAKIEEILQYIDYYFVDIKIMNSKMCKEILGGDFNTFLKNLELLHDNVSKDRIVYRLPLVHGITLERDNIERIKALIIKYQPIKVEIFGVHNLGDKKYLRLNLFKEPVSSVEDSILEEVRDFLNKTNCNVVISKY